MHSTPTVPAARVSAVTATALAPSTLRRRGIAVSVVRIMPVLYSPLIASTARMATTAWLRSMPDRATLAGSCPQPAAWQLTAEAAPAPTAAVSAMTASSSHQVPASVRSLVHSARSAATNGRVPTAANRMPTSGTEASTGTFTRLSGSASRPRGPGRRRPSRRAPPSRPTGRAGSSPPTGCRRC